MKATSAAERRLAARAGRAGIVGVNIGANKDSADRIGDYELGVERFAPLASYLTVNISSPNTPGLRDMQARASLAELLSRVVAARDAAVAKAGRKVPLFLKIAPDLERGRTRGHRRRGAGEGGSTASSSPTRRSRAPGLQVAALMPARPAACRASRCSSARRSCWRRCAGCSDPMSRSSASAASIRPETALEKIRAGADLVQLYTGMIYAGPALPGRIVKGFSKFLDKEGLPSLAEIRDSRVVHWADKAL